MRVSHVAPSPPLLTTMYGSESNTRNHAGMKGSITSWMKIGILMGAGVDGAGAGLRCLTEGSV